MRIEQERLDGFQTRMSEWVASQGLLFQLRYAGSIKGAHSSALGTMFRLSLRLLILLILAGVAFWAYLVVRVDTGNFRLGLRDGVGAALGAEEIQVRGIKRERGYLLVSAIDVLGGEESCFEDLELRGVKTEMGLTDGLLAPWRGNSLQVAGLVARVRSGALTDESAAKSFEAVFWNSENFVLRTILVDDATVFWGYSESSMGRIVGSRLTAKRSPDGWSLLFKGGEFRQNWLKGLSIDRIEAEITRDGFQIHEARLKSREGSVAFTLQMVSGGATPEFEGSGQFQNLAIEDYIDSQYLTLVDGMFSGTFTVSGSTNKQEGFEIVSEISLEEGDQIELRDRIPLFRAISTADRFRSYKKVRLTSGGFRMTTGVGTLRIEEINLRAPRLMRLRGDFSVRAPDEAELDELLGRTKNNSGLFLDEDLGGEFDDDFVFTLRRAADASDASAGEEDSTEGESSILFNPSNGARVGEALAEDAEVRQKQKVFLEGTVRLGVVAAAFERSPSLAAAFPVDEETDYRWLEMIWDKQAPFEIGEALAKRLFELTGEDN